MKNKLFITSISDNAKQALIKKSYFNGAQYARYQLVSIDESTNQTKVQLYIGDIISVLKTVFLQTGIKELLFGNFKLTLKTGANELKLVKSLAVSDIVTAFSGEIHGDGLNSLARLSDSTHVAVANVIGKRGSKEIEYGTIIVPTMDEPGHSSGSSVKPCMISWKKLQGDIAAGTKKVHNIEYDKDKGTFIRTNLCNLDTVYLIVTADKSEVIQSGSKAQNTTAPNKEQSGQQKSSKTSEQKTAEQKAKLLNGLLNAKSPLSFSLTNDYSLDAMQYIMKIHTQGEEIDYMLDPGYTAEQLRALRKAYKAGIDVALIADPKISARTMEGVIAKFEYGLWKVIDVENLRKTAEGQ